MENSTETLSFEAGLRELEEIVARLESGDTPLEEAIRVLRQRCADRLDAAQARIEAIRTGADGRPAAVEPFAAG
jgi:exodeoxyribonuclease VII small subunit